MTGDIANLQRSYIKKGKIKGIYTGLYCLQTAFSHIRYFKVFLPKSHRTERLKRHLRHLFIRLWYDPTLLFKEVKNIFDIT